MGTESLVARGLLRIEALVAEEPLPLVLHQGDHSDRGVEDRAGQLDDALKVFVTGRADHPAALKVAQTQLLIRGDRVGGIGHDRP